MSSQSVRMHVVLSGISVGIGAILSFGFFMFTAWLSMTSFDKVSEHLRFYPFSIITMLICFIVFVVLIVLWIIMLMRQKNKLVSAGVSALFALAGLAIGFVAFLFLSSMSVMI